MNRFYKTQKWFFTVTILIFAVFCSVVVFTERLLTRAERDGAFEEKYVIGQKVSIPKESLSNEKGYYEATAFIIAPSGNVYRKEEIELGEEGLYTVLYRALDAEGGLLEKEYTFLSCARKFSVNTSVSSVKTGFYSYGDYKIDRKAVLASVVSKDVFSFRPIIDLNALKEESFLEFFVTPENIGTEDVQKIVVTLTDIYNAGNFVTIEIKKGEAGNQGAAWAELNSYITGNGTGQIPTGLEKDRSGIVVDGAEYLLHKGDVWGANVKFALPGNPKYVSAANPNNYPEYVGTQTLSLSMKPDSGRIYANGQLVTVLTNEEIYGKDVWSGFTSGEVYLSIEGVGYNASALNLAITKLGGVATLEGGFDENVFVDEEAPVISFESENNLPNAIVGEPYALADARADDKYDGAVSVKKEVYFSYGTEEQVRVNIEKGAFVPFREGKYTVKYIAKDRYKNRTELTLAIYADGEEDERLTATVEDLPNGLSGKKYSLTVPKFENARGDVVWSAEIAHKDKNVVYKVNGQELNFLPEYAGRYEVTYYYKDYIFSGEIKKELVVETSSNPVIFGKAVLPKYMICGCVYDLPEMYGRIYSSTDPMDAVAEIYVKEDGETEKKINRTFVTYAKEKVQFVYRITNGGNSSEFVTEEIPVIEAGYNGIYKIEKYFFGDDLDSEMTTDRIRFSAKSGLQSAETEFINPLQTFDFSVRFAAAGTGFSKISFFLTDISDESIVLKFSYIKRYGAVYFNVNDGEEFLLKNVLFDNFTSPLYLKYENELKAVYPTGVSSLFSRVETDMYGNKFNGFSGAKAYMRIALENIDYPERAKLDVININSQKISNIYMDNVKPQISAKTASGERPYGTVFSVEPVYFGDVLDPSAKCMVSVKAPDGNYVTDDNGVLLSPGQNCSIIRRFKLTQFGAYTVSYVAYDNAENELTFDYVVWSVDVTKPTIKIVSPEIFGKVGKAVSVASIDISDNYTDKLEDFKIYVCVVAPDMQSYSLMKNGVMTKSFTPKSAGTYIIKYLVFDANNNMATASYEIRVS